MRPGPVNAHLDECARSRQGLSGCGRKMDNPVPGRTPLTVFTCRFDQHLYSPAGQGPVVFKRDFILFFLQLGQAFSLGVLRNFVRELVGSNFTNLAQISRR